MTTKRMNPMTTETRGKRPDCGARKRASINAEAVVKELLKHPEQIGRRVGFTDLTPLHGKWIREIVFGTEDYTLQAHRGSYKSSSLAVAIALIMILDPTHNIIFLRKADTDVTEMLRMVTKILRNQLMSDISMVYHGVPVEIVAESVDQVSTNLWSSPMGAPQLLGLGIKSSITGKHARYVITDDICNVQDFQSAAEREHTKLQYDELQNIRNRGGRIINLGTPWHKRDVFKKMPNIHKYDCYTTGLISREQLAKLRKSMAPRLFAANYELKLLSGGEQVFTDPPRIWESPYESDFTLPVYEGEAHVDAAYGGQDYTALTIFKFNRKRGQIYIYGRLWHKAVSSVLPAIMEDLKRFHVWRLYCESNGDKGFLSNEIRYNCNAAYETCILASDYTEVQNKKIKILTYLRKHWPDIVFMPGTDPAYINQIVEYTEWAEHDDAPDSAATVCRYYDTFRIEGMR